MSGEGFLRVPRDERTALPRDKRHGAVHRVAVVEVQVSVKPALSNGRAGVRLTHRATSSLVGAFSGAGTVGRLFGKDQVLAVLSRVDRPRAAIERQLAPLRVK